jgi:hypothetical protein
VRCLHQHKHYNFTKHALLNSSVRCKRFLSAPVSERVLLRLLAVIQSHLLQVSGIPPHTHYSSPLCQAAALSAGIEEKSEEQDNSRSVADARAAENRK